MLTETPGERRVRGLFLLEGKEALWLSIAWKKKGRMGTASGKRGEMEKGSERAGRGKKNNIQS